MKLATSASLSGLLTIAVKKKKKISFQSKLEIQKKEKKTRIKLEKKLTIHFIATTIFFL